MDHLDSKVALTPNEPARLGDGNSSVANRRITLTASVDVSPAWIRVASNSYFAVNKWHQSCCGKAFRQMAGWLHQGSDTVLVVANNSYNVDSMAEIAPSILSADFARLADDVAVVARAGVRMIHIDVMDGHFVPNISIGVPVVQSLRKATDLYLDCHLMIDDPDAYAPAFIEAGAQTVTIHQEATRHLHRSLQLIKSHGASAGVAINPATPVETLDLVLDMADLVLVMSVNPGFGGQAFLPVALTKIEQLDRIRQERGLSFEIEVDGGVGPDNIAGLARAGCDIFVAGSSVFGTPDPAQAVESLKELASSARVLQA